MQKPDKRAIGERIRKHREELNMSREQLSEIMGITSKFLSDIEFGLRGFSIEKLFLFSESLNLSTEYILFGTGPSINDRIFLQSINKCPEEKKEYLLLILNKIIESYKQESKWAKSALLNVAHAGKFSSDRTIQEYVDDIWHLDKIEVHLEDLAEADKIV